MVEPDAIGGLGAARPGRMIAVDTATAAGTTRAPAETLAIPIGGVSEAQLRISFGGGELMVHPAETGTLLSGTFEGGVVQHRSGPGRIALKPPTEAYRFVDWAPLRWDVGVTREIPVDLRLDTGANRSTIDLGALRVRRLELHTGASETRMRLPTAGQTAVRVECGFAKVAVEVPEGVAARIHGKMGLGALEVNQARFPRIEGGWVSPDYETAPNRVDITVEGGFGSVSVT
jgi:hypothetical protein